MKVRKVFSARRWDALYHQNLQRGLILNGLAPEDVLERLQTSTGVAALALCTRMTVHRSGVMPGTVAAFEFVTRQRFKVGRPLFVPANGDTWRILSRQFLNAAELAWGYTATKRGNVPAWFVARELRISRAMYFKWRASLPMVQRKLLACVMKGVQPKTRGPFYDEEDVCRSAAMAWFRPSNQTETMRAALPLYRRPYADRYAVMADKATAAQEFNPNG